MPNYNIAEFDFGDVAFALANNGIVSYSDAVHLPILEALKLTARLMHHFQLKEEQARLAHGRSKRTR